MFGRIGDAKGAESRGTFQLKLSLKLSPKESAVVTDKNVDRCVVQRTSIERRHIKTDLHLSAIHGEPIESHRILREVAEQTAYLRISQVEIELAWQQKETTLGIETSLKQICRWERPITGDVLDPAQEGLGVEAPAVRLPCEINAI